ncbi:unnamed protein product [Didymodactylos carnosus]|uniref:Uncharacterized protein n=1 Tax=Didymodactylos carnosus TaxID=1234261 RepID=A0A815A7X5_9BILA|nr:unnamed protein product [Didymodactylos carnosus]CAF4023539.1 unnamed protein product [Didymodactylos carnosus]
MPPKNSKKARRKEKRNAVPTQNGDVDDELAASVNVHCTLNNGGTATNSSETKVLESNILPSANELTVLTVETRVNIKPIQSSIISPMPSPLVADVPPSSEASVIPKQQPAQPNRGRFRNRPQRIPITSAIPEPPLDTRIVLPARPPVDGKAGDRIQIYTNHFNIDFAKNMILYQYDVVVEKFLLNSQTWIEVSSRDQRRKFVNALIDENIIKPACVVWYDEGKCLYSTTNLTSHLPITTSLPTQQSTQYRLIIKILAAQWSTRTIWDYIKNQIPAPPPHNAVRILETLFKQAMNKIAHCEKNVFYRKDQQPEVLDDGFELRSGFFQSICLTQSGPTLNVDTTLTKFYPHMDILEFVSIQLDKDIRKYGMNMVDYDRARTVLRNCKVTTVQSNHTQVYVIRGFAEIPENIILDIYNQEGDVAEAPIKQNLIKYYKSLKTPITINYTKLRCLEVYFMYEKKDPKHLPMEVCRILEWQECETESREQQRTRQLKSIPKPGSRYDCIMDSVNACQLNNPKNILYNSIQLNVDIREMKLIQGRILPPPIINNNNAEINMGRINLKGRFVEPRLIQQLAFVYFGLPMSLEKKDVVRQFSDSFLNVSKRYRMGPALAPTKHTVDVYHPPNDDYDQELGDTLQKFFGARQKAKCELVVCILDSPHPQLYSLLKQTATKDFGITTQCLLYSKLMEQIDKFNRTQRGNPHRILDNMCENLVKKVNFKLNGQNTAVNLDVPLCKKKSKTDMYMFFGADVLHPHRCSAEKPSIAAVVGSGDSICSTSAVRVSKQWPKSGKCAIEAIVDIENMVYELLEYYVQWNSKLPNKVVFYRDGVDDGQFLRIKNYEIPKIKQAFERMYDDDLPLLTFIVVKKRHHTRLFTYENNQTNNVPCGLVIDTTITNPSQFSFFLNSHKALQGTNKPALYHVLHDEIGFTADEIQLLTYYLCYSDPRSSTSEAIPSVTHQADLAASKARSLFADTDLSTNDGYAVDALENPTLEDIRVEMLRVHADMENTPHFG